MKKVVKVPLDKKFNLPKGYQVISKSLDARGAPKGRKPCFSYTIDLEKNLNQLEDTFKKVGPLADTPLIVGLGPAGIFCALRFAEYGIKSVIVERGKPVKQRMRDIAKYWRYGVLDEESNVCYGEGGAGLYSDGKLFTRIKSPYVSYVMEKLAQFGAPDEVKYLTNPHVGSNKLRGIIERAIEFLKDFGCQFHYSSKVTSLIENNKSVSGVVLEDGKKLFSSNIVLAVGHSAHDFYLHLNDIGVALKAKGFAVGVRIEHRRSYINKIQYGNFAEYEELGAARYRLSYNDKTQNRGTYSFCMCPGGYVLSSGTNKNGLVTNGMSNYRHNSPWSNSAIVVTVDEKRDLDPSNVLSGLNFQRDIEKKAFELSSRSASGRELPVMLIEDFLANKHNNSLYRKSSSPSGVVSVNINEIFPDFVTQQLRQALLKFDKNINGFSDAGNALLFAPETRTSSPIRIERDKNTLMSISHQGIYPCGEGAGYAGGITSSAVDGVKVAVQILKNEGKL